MPNISDFHVGDVVRFSDGSQSAKITGLELTDGRERVRVTRFHEARKSNVTTWMKWSTFRKRGPVIIARQTSFLAGSAIFTETTYLDLHAQIELARRFMAAGIWSGKTPLELYNPYSLHNRVFGVAREPVSELRPGVDFIIRDK